MRAVVFHGAGDVRVEQVPDARIVHSTDAVVRVVRSCICGSDLWRYRGIAGVGAHDVPSRIGHEFIGVVEEVGPDVGLLQAGDFVVAPFLFNEGSCTHCASGLPSSCVSGGIWGTTSMDGGQGEAVRVPFADATLVGVPTLHGEDPSGLPEALLLSLLALSDVMGTGHHAAMSARVGAGSTVVVIGDGAVGLSAVLACKRLGAERIVLLGRHPGRTDIGRQFGATDVIAERGAEAIEAVMAATDGGASHVIEGVGTDDSWETAIGVARPGARVGYVGVPHGTSAGLPLARLFASNISIAGGLAPVRAYLPALVDEVIGGRLDPSAVFDQTLALADASIGYEAMHERTALKTVLLPAV